MVKTAQPGCGHDSGWRARASFYGSLGRSVLVESNVRPVLMVIGEIVAAKPPKMEFV
jgi:hypothetical protein